MIWRNFKISNVMRNWKCFAMAFLLYGCIEPFELSEADFVDFESAIVVEATITNELKEQIVYVTRSFKFEEQPTAESNADIRVVGGGTIYSFTETEPGIYVSMIPFAATANVNYQLLIDTADGNSYNSDEVTLTPVTTLDAIRAERIVNSTDEDGIAIFADSFDPTGTSLNYRYTYEETYKIIPPNWSPNELVGDPGESCGVSVRLKERDERVCYTTDFSNAIVLTNTNDLDEDRVDRFMVRFLNRDNYIISHRYSILVKQHVQSSIAYNFYETLREFSGEESLFSETQPGFLEGNIISNQSEDEKVLGFFDVASVSQKRIFFNYEDYYPDEPLPPYVTICRPSAPPLASLGGSCVLKPIIESGNARYYQDNATPNFGEGPYQVVTRVCGDCTVLGKLEVPTFWVE